eukprot:9433087-Pyramimonas_sp.AAC.1
MARLSVLVCSKRFACTRRRAVPGRRREICGTARSPPTWGRACPGLPSFGRSGCRTGSWAS